MSNEVTVALITLVGSAMGTIGGIVVTSKLTNFRLEQLEKKVDKHNSVVERTFILEEKMKVANHRIDDLEKGRG
ncbi:hypothetical protein KQI42_14925 [Tissierella sp. MSJ-40]|uniref:Phage protein n=1 Tax=Tissierella simiarum TaxID=2841534 RepID=A0ABS6EA77_9FIRM|nr:hypothetical protein [Tissierella simiarum]MBU5439315.1 hypothetical protein [Tissierella simiarum]